MAHIKQVNLDNGSYLIEPTLYAAATVSSDGKTYTASFNTNFELVDGVCVQIKCPNKTNTAPTTFNTKNIYYNGEAIASNTLKANHTYALVYDGTQWQLVGDIDTNTTYTNGTGLNLNNGEFSVKYGNEAGTAVQGNDTRLSDARTPTSHTHGNITNDGKVGNGNTLLKTVNGEIQAGPAIGTDDTKFLNNKGEWAVPAYTTNTDEKVKQTPTTTNADYELLFSESANNNELTESARKTSTLKYNPNSKTLTIDSGTLTGTNYSGKSANATAADAFSSNAKVELTGDVTGSNNSTKGWTISTTIGDKKVTPTKMSDDATISIGTQAIKVGSSFNTSTLLTDLGLSSAMHYRGTSATIPPESGTYSTGDVLIDSTSSKEYVYDGTTWRELGDESSFKIKQTAVSSPSVPASGTTTATAFIDSISQDVEGVITATKKNLPIASTTTAGIIQIGTEATSAAAGNHTHGNISNDGKIGTTNNLVVTSSGSISAGATLSSEISSQTSSTKFLREDGTFAAPSYVFQLMSRSASSLKSTAGNFVFYGSSLFPDIHSGWDWIGIQLGYSTDKWQLAGATLPEDMDLPTIQLTGASNHLYFRQNDSGGTNSNDWLATVCLLDSGMLSSAYTITEGDSLVIKPASSSLLVKKSSITFSAAIDTQTTSSKFLREDGTWAIPSYTTNTDEKVKQNSNTDNKEFSILLKTTNNATSETGEVNFGATTDKLVTVNPSTGRITAPGGLAGTADSATNLSTTPVLAAGTTDTNAITVTAGNQTSNELVVPHATTASQVYITNTTPTTNTSYYLTFVSSSTSDNQSILNNSLFRPYLTANGTAAYFYIGDSSHTGNIGLYDGSSHCGTIVTANLTANRTYTLPNTAGTIALTKSNITGTASNITGTLAVDHGGTNITSYIIGDMLYASATTTLSKLSANTTTTRKFLRSVATTADTPEAPEWDTLTADDIPTITKSKISDFSHTHNYAGSSSAGGPATYLGNIGRLTNMNVNFGSTTYNSKFFISYADGSTTSNKPYQNAMVLNIAWDNTSSNKYGAQIAIGNNATPHLQLRGCNNGTWDSSWLTVLDSNNYNTYAAAKSHTHGNITNSGTIGTANAARVVVTNTSNEITVEDLTVTDDNASDSATTTFVQAVTQSATGKITVTKAALDTSGNWNGLAATATADASGNTITTTYATKTEMNGLLAAADAMIFKGTIGAGGTINTTADPAEDLPSIHEAGWTYYVITPGTYKEMYCEEGTLIVCIQNRSTAIENDVADWTSIETNEDGSVIGPSSSTDNHIALFDGTSGRIIKQSNFTIEASVPSDAVFTDVNVTATANTNKTFYLIGASGSSTATGTMLKSKDIWYTSNNTSGDRKSELVLGNSTSTGNSGGRYGQIRLYGNVATYYLTLAPITGLTANHSLTLPNKDGTLMVGTTSTTTNAIAIYSDETGTLANSSATISNGTITATAFNGPLTGDVTGDVSGTATKVTTTTNTSDSLYLVGVKSGATSTLLHDTSITAAGSVLTIDTLTITGGATNASMSSTGTLTIGNAANALTVSTTTAALTISTTDGALEAKSTGTGTVKLTGASGAMTISTTTGTLTIQTNSSTNNTGNMVIQTAGTNGTISITSATSTSISADTTMSITGTQGTTITSGSGYATIFKINTTEYGRFNTNGMFQLNDTGTQDTHKLYVNGNSAFNGHIAIGEQISNAITEKVYMAWNATDQSLDFVFA